MYTRALFIITLAIAQSCVDVGPAPRVTFEQARKAALTQAPGHITKEELRHENGRWIYSFAIQPGEFDDSSLLHIAVDAGADG